MSRKIDLTQPLSDEDRAYLVSRGRLADIAKADAVAEGGEFHDSMLTEGTVMQHSSYVIPPNTGSVNAGGQPPTVMDDEPVLTDIGQTRPNPEGEEDESYSSWTVHELREEIDNRNADREEVYQLDKPSKKADLIAVLEADDASDESQENEEEQ